MKDKITKEYLRRTTKLLETKLSGRNLLKARNTLGLFLKLTSGEVQQMDQSRRKLMTLHKALYVRDNIDYMHQEKKEAKDSAVLKIAWIH